VPAKNDSRLVRLASEAITGDLLLSGVRMFGFNGGLLHTKSITVDGQLALFGSLNLDPRSLWLNFEISVLIYDAEFTGAIRALQEEYLLQSTEIRLEDWQSCSPWRRVLRNAVRLLAPLLYRVRQKATLARSASFDVALPYTDGGCLGQGHSIRGLYVHCAGALSIELANRHDAPDFAANHDVLLAPAPGTRHSRWRFGLVDCSLRTHLIADRFRCFRRCYEPQSLKLRQAFVPFAAAGQAFPGAVLHGHEIRQARRRAA
jgi:hypothetical protein